MTSSLIAPVIPSATAPASGRHSARQTRRLPLAEPQPAAGRDSDVVYGFGRIDASGRIADRAIVNALGWRGGDRLSLTAEAGVILARRDPGGMITVPARPVPATFALDSLRAGQEPARPLTLAVIVGVGGAGKTSLALRWLPARTGSPGQPRTASVSSPGAGGRQPGGAG